MRKRIYLLCLIGAGSIYVGSCSPGPIYISFKREADRLHIGLKEPTGFFVHGEKDACVDKVSITRAGENWAHPLWQMALPKGRDCVSLGSFALGSLPAGFRENAPLPKNLKGKYVLHAFGDGVGHADFDL